MVCLSLAVNATILPSLAWRPSFLFISLNARRVLAFTFASSSSCLLAVFVTVGMMPVVVVPLLLLLFVVESPVDVFAFLAEAEALIFHGFMP